MRYQLADWPVLSLPHLQPAAGRISAAPQSRPWSGRRGGVAHCACQEARRYPLTSAGERVTNSRKGCPAWRHPERVSEMIFTDAEAI
jgi:hypothetical protein